MNTREITNQYRLSQWSQILAERLADESVDEFCDRTRISKSQFFYWQRKLRDAACEQLAEATTAVIPSGWAVCETTEHTIPKADANSIAIEIGNCRVNVEESFNPDLLKRVCETLVTLC